MTSTHICLTLASSNNVCSRTYVYQSARMTACMYVHVYTCTRVSVYACKRIRVYACTRVRVYACTRVQMYARNRMGQEVVTNGKKIIALIIGAPGAPTDPSAAPLRPTAPPHSSPKQQCPLHPTCARARMVRAARKREVKITRNMMSNHTDMHHEFCDRFYDMRHSH